MSMINLSDAKVFYEGQTLPAINLISKLQTQIQETATHMAAISATLGDLQTSLLNSHSIEVKLTLSKEDFDRFRALGGVDDAERVRKAVMNVIHSEADETLITAAESRVTESRQVPSFNEPRPAAVAIESGPLLPEAQAAGTLQTAPMDAKPVERLQDVPSAGEAIKKKSTTKCPRCQSLIDLPEISNEHWPVEVKCGNCGAKCLIKSKTVSSAAKADKTGFEPLDETAFGKLFDMIST